MSTGPSGWVSDAVVDLLVEAGVEHVAFNPGATFRAVHDSLIHHRGDAPSIVLCAHEEISVALAHGYAKATGRPMAVLLHDVVGLQHATMAIFNAWCDRVPILLLGGTGPMSTAKRRPWIDWIHTALVQGQQVRDYVKWDDQPADAGSIPVAFARAWNVARSAPPGPVYLCLDAELQEQPRDDAPGWPGLAAYAQAAPPAPRNADLDEVADLLRTAELPVLVTDYAGASAAAFSALVELAELLQAPVIDRGARLSFPSPHELNFSDVPQVLDEADVVVAVDVEDLHGALQAGQGSAGSATVVHLTPQHLKIRSWTHDHQQLAPAHRVLTATAETALPELVARCHAAPVSDDQLRRRGERLRGRALQQWEARWEHARTAEAAGAIAPARLAAELWPLIENQRWTLTHGKPDGWERRLWRFTRPGQHLGWHGGGGLGYGLPASIGAAMALGGESLCIDLQPDGDLLFTPSALWTAARYRVPLLIIVQNNRQYQNTVEHAEEIARIRGRGIDRRHVGAAVSDPDVDFATLARSYGVWAAGPIVEPEQLLGALSEALRVVRSGLPALVDAVVTGR